MDNVSVEDMMLCREQRVKRQRELLAEHRGPLVSFTLNIAGPVKTSPLIERAFDQMALEIRRRLSFAGMPVVADETIRRSSGPEMLLACRDDALAIKKALCVLEEQDEFGRLMDIDVIAASGEKISREEAGLAPRRCLMCAERAAVCARSRRHSLEELSAKTAAILEYGLIARMADSTGEKAQLSLLTEVTATPKPGLVDLRNTGAHRDMTLQHFISSACALRSYFESCAREGAAMARQEPPALMERLRLHGLLAEQRMLEASGGVNTHKGAIYGLGILCGAAGRLQQMGVPLTCDALLNAAGQIARHETDGLPSMVKDDSLTGGMRQYLRHGSAGARGEAANGFPAVRHIGLPALTEALSQGKSLNDSAVHALLCLMAHVEDSNVFKRAGRERQLELMRDMADFIAKPYDLSDVESLDERLIKENISPGGCADILAFTLFVRSMCASQAD